LRASSHTDHRRGAGFALALALWVVGLALINALVQSQAAVGAAGATARMVHTRTAVFAARSALEEAAFALRHPQTGVSRIVEGFEAGRASGAAYEPVETRSLYQPVRVAVEPVAYEFVGGLPDAKKDRCLVDITVRVRADPAATGVRALTRRMRRRYPARFLRVIETMGPRKGEVVHVMLSLARDPVLEVLEP
jgi:hypothetical protein